MLNWIIWNKNASVCSTELLEIEQFWHLNVLDKNYTEFLKLELFE